MKDRQNFVDRHQLYNRRLSEPEHFYQKLILWSSNTKEDPISTIAIHELELAIILDVQIPALDRINLNIKVTSETVLIHGCWKESAQENCIYPNEFERLILLPHTVRPQTVGVMQQDSKVSIHLTKLLDINLTTVRLNLTNPDSGIVLSYAA
jgi:HSP20 family molecular chaperone IbpA